MGIEQQYLLTSRNIIAAHKQRHVNYILQNLVCQLLDTYLWIRIVDEASG